MVKTYRLLKKLTGRSGNMMVFRRERQVLFRMSYGDIEPGSVSITVGKTKALRFIRELEEILKKDVPE